jgi:hypothetical protein
MAIRFFTRLAVRQQLGAHERGAPYLWISPWTPDFRGELGLRRRFVVVG